MLYCSEQVRTFCNGGQTDEICEEKKSGCNIGSENTRGEGRKRGREEEEERRKASSSTASGGALR